MVTSKIANVLIHKEISVNKKTNNISGEATETTLSYINIPFNKEEILNNKKVFNSQ